MLDEESKKQALMRSKFWDEYNALLQVEIDKSCAIKNKIEITFSAIHEQLTQATKQSPLLAPLLKSISNLIHGFRYEVLANEKNYQGLKKVEALQEAVKVTLNPEARNEEKIKAIDSFESMSQKSLYKADHRLISHGHTYMAMATVLLSLALVGLIVATSGVALAIAPFLLGVGMTTILAGIGCAAWSVQAFSNSNMPSSMNGKLRQVSSHGLFSSKSIPTTKQSGVQLPKACLV